MAAGGPLCALLMPVMVLFSLVGSNELPYEEVNRRGVEYTLPELGFGVTELEPSVDEATIRAHHGGHHLTYTNNLNKVLQDWRHQFPHDALAKGSILEILQNIDLVPEKFKTSIRNQGGGFVNHCFYWAGMSGNPDNKDRHPPAKLGADIDHYFGGFSQFKESFSNMAKSLFGSGYVWLSRDEDDALVLTSSVNQDSPVSQGLKPILVIDVWEHAYYLRHQYRRANYIRDWWKVVDWTKVDALDLWWADLDNFSINSKDEL